MHDLDFNPVNDRQAEDRCHRIGQTRPVTVYKMVAASTVDEKILNLGDTKSKVNSALLDVGSKGPKGKSSSDKSGAAPGKADASLQTVSGILADALREFLDE